MADSESDLERLDITVMLVDDDPKTLSLVAGILRSFKYKVATASSGHEALETLRELRGFFDIVVTDLYMPGMNGFELQKHVKREFQLPVVIMSADRRKRVMSRTLANGASFYIVKPVSRDDFKNIWQYVVAARKEKFLVEGDELLLLEGSQEGESSPCEKSKNIPSQNVNSGESVGTSGTRPKRKYNKRKGPQLQKDDVAGSPGTAKKPKIVWTTSLHNRFLLAIRHIGMDRAVPKKILEIMNVPSLTRENVASHLQKYRIFLKKVAEKGIIEGLSERALRSRFAAGLPTALVRDMQKRAIRFRYHHHHHHRQPPTLNISRPKPLTTANNISRPQPPPPQFPYNPSPTRPSLLNEIRLGQSNLFGTNPSYQNFQQPQLFHGQPNHLLNRHILPAYNGNGGLVTSANVLNANGQVISNHAGSLGNNSSFNYESINNCNNNNYGGWMQVPSGSTILQPFSSSTNYNYYGNLNNNGSLMAAGRNQSQTAGYVGRNNNISNNRFGLLSNGSASNNANTAVPSSVLNDSVESAQENISGLSPLPHQSINGIGNAEGHRHNQYGTPSSMTDIEAYLFDENLNELFLMLDDMELLDKTDESPRASEIMNRDISSPFNAEQCLEQFQGVGDQVNAPTNGSSINVLPNQSPICTTENPNQLLSDDMFSNLEPLDMYMVDNANSSARNSAPQEQEWDIDLIESLFGTADQN